MQGFGPMTVFITIPFVISQAYTEPFAGMEYTFGSNNLESMSARDANLNGFDATVVGGVPVTGLVHVLGTRLAADTWDVAGTCTQPHSVPCHAVGYAKLGAGIIVDIVGELNLC